MLRPQARRSLSPLLTLTLLSTLPLAAGCAHAPHSTGPTVEIALDSGRAEERPLTPAKSFELLMKIDPGLPAYTPLRLRLLLAQAGHLTLTIYDTTSAGQPGAKLATLDRDYPPELVSSGHDGKWIVEPLSLPVLHAPLWVGLSSSGAGDVRLWASSNDSGSVFARDPDPATPLSANRIPRTPMLRVEVSPAP